MTQRNNLLTQWEGLERPLTQLPRWAAFLIFFLLAAAMAWSAWAMASAPAAGSAVQVARVGEGGGDLALYRRITDRVAAGENYYAAAIDEQRSGNYPTRPFVTVRLPTLALLHRFAGEEGLTFVIKLLWPLVGAMLMVGLKGETSRPEWVAVGVFTLLGGAAAIIPSAPLIHEVLAGLLLGLALALYHPDRWWPALIAAGLALAIRELAAPFLALWLAFAVLARRPREALAVLAVLLLFSLGMVLHYQGVEAQRMAGDMPTQGWNALAGPILPLTALSRLTALLFLPPWLSVPLALLPLVGWFALGGRLGLFAALWFAGFIFAMALFARPENFYWAQMVLPAYLAGFAFVPRAFADLSSAARATRLKQS